MAKKINDAVKKVIAKSKAKKVSPTVTDETEIEAVDVTFTCDACNGRGLETAYSLCKPCQGSGIIS